MIKTLLEIISSIYSSKNIKELQYTMVTEFASEHIAHADQKIRQSATNLLAKIYNLVGADKIENLI